MQIRKQVPFVLRYPSIPQGDRSFRSWWGLPAISQAGIEPYLRANACGTPLVNLFWNRP